MKILLVTPYFTPDLGPSAFMLSMLAEDLTQFGHHVTVLAAVPHFPTGIVPQEHRHGLWKWDQQKAVRICRVRVPTGNRNNLWHRLFTFLVYQVLASFIGIRQNYDVALITNPVIETGLPFLFLCSLRHKPVVFAVWDLYPEVVEQVGVFRSRTVFYLVKLLEDFCLRHANKVQALVEGFLPNLNARIGFPNRVVYIPAWVDTDNICPLSRHNHFSKEFELDAKFVILYAGNLGYLQGLENIIASAKKVSINPKIRFVFVGDGAALPDLLKLVEELNLPNVLFFPYQPSGNMPELLAIADLTLVSLVTGVGASSLPSKTISYLASGRPILAVTDEGNDLWKLVNSSQSGRCITPGRPDLLADIILELAESPDTLRVMGKNGRAYAIAHHSRQVAAQKFEGIFKQIATESTSNSGK